MDPVYWWEQVPYGSLHVHRSEAYIAKKERRDATKAAKNLRRAKKEQEAKQAA